MTARRLLRTFYLLVALRWLPVGAIVPFGVLFMQERGLELTDVGVAIAAYSIVVAVLELPTGGLADSLGRRPVLIISEAFSLTGMVLVLAANSLAMFVTAWAVLGVGRALNSGALDAWFVDAIHDLDPDYDLHQPLSVAGAIGGLAIGVGAVAAGFLPKLVDFEGSFLGMTVTELTIPFLAALAVGALHVIGVVLLVKEPRRRAEERAIRGAIADVPSVVARSVKMATRTPVIRLLMLAMITIGIALSTIETLWPPQFAEILGGAEGNTEVFGVLAAIGFGAAALGSALSPRYVTLFRKRQGTSAGVARIGFAVGLVGLGVAGTVAFAGSAYLLFYIFVGLVGPIHQTLLHGQVTSVERSTMLSADSLALQAGGLVGILGSTRIADAAGLPVAWFVVAGLTALSAFFYFSIQRKL